MASYTGKERSRQFERTGYFNVKYFVFPLLIALVLTLVPAAAVLAQNPALNHEAFVASPAAYAPAQDGNPFRDSSRSIGEDEDEGDDDEEPVTDNSDFSR